MITGAVPKTGYIYDAQARYYAHSAQRCVADVTRYMIHTLLLMRATLRC